MFKKSIIALILCSLALFDTSAVFSQMIMEYKGRYYVGDRKLSEKELKNMLGSNPMSKKEYRAAKGSESTASFFASIGGFMIGWPIGTYLGGGEPNWAMAGAGLVILMPGLMADSSRKKHMRNAISIFNSGFSVNDAGGDMRFAMMLLPGSLEMVYRF